MVHEPAAKRMIRRDQPGDATLSSPSVSQQAAVDRDRLTSSPTGTLGDAFTV
jgi:hypothetical protein